MPEQRQCQEMKLARMLVATSWTLIVKEMDRYNKKKNRSAHQIWWENFIKVDQFRIELAMNEGPDVPYDRIEEICKFADQLRLQVQHEKAA